MPSTISVPTTYDKKSRFKNADVGGGDGSAYYQTRHTSNQRETNRLDFYNDKSKKHRKLVEKSKYVKAVAD
jgi:hypothetical protein